MPTEYILSEIARLPLPGDNVAVVTQRLPPGAIIVDGDRRFSLSHGILEGHRFAVEFIPEEGALLSWGLPFGYATRPILPGEYVCNASVLEMLSLRNLDFPLPPEPNFEDSIEPYKFDPASWQPSEQVSRYAEMRTFLGYRRPGNRGVGTRNYIVLLGTTSRTGSYVKQLEARVAGLAKDYPNVDGIVAVAHTEGGSEHPNNLKLLLRTLAGFMVNPNVGAVLAVDYGVEPVTNRMLQTYLSEHNYPIADLPYRFLSLTGPFLANLAEGEEQVRAWLPLVDQARRTPEALAHLKLALQCGGSDAFSGISANPLLGWVANEIIRYGGAANLAETDELIGAELYVLKKTRDLATAQKFLATVERFKQRVAWHGHSAEGNPSGGNKYRGLYNIVLKSIGAAMKKNPATRLDYVIDYGERMEQPGYYFMDSPGNDLESIAGQIAAGSNMIFFTTGNGSVTNFPFVPTIKMVTTTRRFNLLSRDMDVNAGAYLENTPMQTLGRATLELTVAIASGQRSAGERAGHAQTQIWRDWRQTDAGKLAELLNRPIPDGTSLPVRPPAAPAPAITLPTFRRNGRRSLDQVGLVLPTSLCAGQVARMAANRLNRQRLGQAQGVSRFVALVHTEGCGVSGGTSEELYVRTMLGYLSHPMVAHCLLLEHGCEKTHNDYMRAQMKAAGIDPASLGWASVQLDGGIDAALEKVDAWFADAVQERGPAPAESAGLDALRVALASAGPVSNALAAALAQLTTQVVAAGGTVVAPQNSGLLSSPVYLAATVGDQPAYPTLAYGAPMTTGGFHVMETPTQHWVETLTGLGATGVDIIVAAVGEHPLQTHPLVPMLQVTDQDDVVAAFGDDMDLHLTGDPADWPAAILTLIADVACRRYAPRLYQLGNVDFQVTRGLLGVSM
jgi:altronate dehydratase